MKPGRTLINVMDELRAQGTYLHHLMGHQRELPELPKIARKLRSLAAELDNIHEASTAEPKPQ